MNAFHGAATLRLETDRLVLVALTAELVDALADREAAQVTLGAVIPDGWPDTELAGTAPDLRAAGRRGAGTTRLRPVGRRGA